MGMNVLNLGIISSPLTPIIAASGCQVIEYSDEIDLLFLKNNVERGLYGTWLPSSL